MATRATSTRRLVGGTPVTSTHFLRVREGKDDFVDELIFARFRDTGVRVVSGGMTGMKSVE